MGGLRCKVIADYNNLAAESTALFTLADHSPQHPDMLALAAEAAATAKAAYGGWVAGLEAADYDNGAHAQDVLTQSLKVCDWAKAVRSWCDAISDGHSETPYANWIRTMRHWRDDDAAFYQAFVNETAT